jgi:hypothetical protein
MTPRGGAAILCRMFLVVSAVTPAGSGLPGAAEAALAWPAGARS